jgi:chemotaxis protein CheX
MAAPKTSNPGEIATPRSDWLAVLRDTTREVFSIMVGASVVDAETAGCPVIAHVTGVIGITGAMRAIFTLYCSYQSATKVASQMLGVSAEEAASQKTDAIGEICNMVAGHFKLKIGYGGGCELTIPSVIIGRDYQVYSRAAEERLEFAVMYEGEPVWLALDIRK